MKNRLKQLIITATIITATLAGAAGVYAQTNLNRSIDNPQSQMLGARAMTLGGQNPTLLGDIHSLMINPAVLGYIDYMPVAISSQRILNEFEYQLVNVSLPFDVAIPFQPEDQKQRIIAGLSYGGIVLNNIQQTELENAGVTDEERIRQIGSFNSGFMVLNGSLGTQFYDIYGFNSVSVGLGGKIVRQFVLGDARYAFGIDVGIIGEYHLDYLFFNRITVGASALNVLSTPLKYPDQTSEAYLPLEAYVGVKADMFDETFSLMANNSIRGIAVSGEYLIDDSLVIRLGTDLQRYSIGTGLLFENIAGLGSQDYSIRLDYNYTFNPYPFSEDGNHTISLSVLGESRPGAPQILLPDDGVLVNERHINLKGVGPKSTTIRIYNGENLSRTTETDRYGQWGYPGFPLKEGENTIYVKSYSLEKDISFESNKVLVTSDTIAPPLNVRVFPDRGQLRVTVTSTDELSTVQGAIEKTNLGFAKLLGGVWTASIPMPADIQNGAVVPSIMKTLDIYGKDIAGNETPVQTIPFFIALQYPQNRHVHYRPSVRLIGTASPMVSRIMVDGNGVYIDQNYKFSIAQDLDPGKNLVRVNIVTLNDDMLTYFLKVLRLVTFPDVNETIRERREIEFMATLGVIKGDEEDGLFRPDAPVTRMYLTRMMVDANNLELPEVGSNIFEIAATDPNARYVQAAIQNGLIFAFPNGTFRPNQPVTLSEAVFLLSNAGIIDEVEVENGDRVITRKELAQFLAFTPRYEILIEDLIDWETGYR